MNTTNTKSSKPIRINLSNTLDKKVENTKQKQQQQQQQQQSSCNVKEEEKDKKKKTHLP